MLKAGMAGAFAPVVAMVTNADGTANNAMYFWMTGALSAFWITRDLPCLL